MPTIKNLMEYAIKAADPAMLTYLISEENRRLPDLYSRLGELVYNRACSNESLDLESEPVVEMIDEARCNIDRMEEALANVLEGRSSVCEAEPISEPEAVSEPEPFFTSVPEPVQEPIFEPEPEPVFATEPEPVEEPVFEPEPEPVEEPVFAPIPEPVPVPEPEVRFDAPKPGPEEPAKTFCTGCGSPLIPGAAFCLGCGKKVARPAPTPAPVPQPKPAPAPSPAPVPPAPQKKFCTKCGHQLVRDSAFCPACGARLK